MGYCITALIIDLEAAKHQRVNYRRVSASSCHRQELTAPLQRGRSRRQDSRSHHGLTMRCWPGMVTTHGEKVCVPASRRKARRVSCRAQTSSSDRGNDGLTGSTGTLRVLRAKQAGPTEIPPHPAPATSHLP